MRMIIMKKLPASLVVWWLLLVIIMDSALPFVLLTPTTTTTTRKIFKTRPSPPTKKCTTTATSSSILPFLLSGPVELRLLHRDEENNAILKPYYYGDKQQQEQQEDGGGDCDLLMYETGSSDEFVVVKQWKIPKSIDWTSFLNSMSSSMTSSSSSSSLKTRFQKKWDIDIDSSSSSSFLNVTLPIALMIWDIYKFPTLSKARKACRQRRVVIKSITTTSSTTNTTEEKETQNQVLRFGIGKVGDRVISGNIIGIQDRRKKSLIGQQGKQQYTDCISITAKPSFDSPVIYEDDSMAIVNKPAGVLVYKEGSSGYGGRNTIKFALPYVLEPPKLSNDDNDNDNDDDILPRPEIVHRLDKATSGLLVVAKTKTAVQNLCHQFEHRVIQKTYQAIVHGIPGQHQTCSNNNNTNITGTNRSQALTPTQVIEFLGHDVANKIDCLNGWNLAECVLERKHAITLWRIIQTSPTPAYNSNIANGSSSFLSLVELMPKTGRYHQLRRQMSWMYNTPIVGDTIYGSEFCYQDKIQRYYRGLMLCATSITLIHPKCYLDNLLSSEESSSSSSNSIDGGIKNDDDNTNKATTTTCIKENGLLHDSIYVSASIRLPSKFQKYIQMQEKRARSKLST